MIEEIIELMKKERVITAEIVATRFNISLNKAKSILDIIQDQGIIKRGIACSNCIKSCSGCM